MRKAVFILAALVLMAASAQASPLNVMATGTVLFNGVQNPPLNGVNGGETATVSFMVDSDNFVESLPGDVRAYVIDPASFTLSFSGGVNVGLLGDGPTAYFALVDGFPVSDGFFVSESTVSPGGVQLEQAPVNFNLDIGYEEFTLTSLDILEAKGVYMFDGLTRYSMTLWQVFPDNAVMEMDFSMLSIANEPVSVNQTSFGRVKAMYR
jgi:hypothetical protein